MQTKAFQPQSHFDSIFNFICPSGLEKFPSSVRTGIVYDIFFEATIDHIVVNMDICTSMEADEADDWHETIYLNHDKFRAWLEKENYLTITTGSNHQSGGDIVEEEDDYSIGYAEFCEDHLTSDIIAKYLTEANLVKHTFQL